MTTAGIAQRLPRIVDVPALPVLIAAKIAPQSGEHSWVTIKPDCNGGAIVLAMQAAVHLTVRIPDVEISHTVNLRSADLRWQCKAHREAERLVIDRADGDRLRLSSFSPQRAVSQGVVGLPNPIPPVQAPAGHPDGADLDPVLLSKAAAWLAELTLGAVRVTGYSAGPVGLVMAGQGEAWSVQLVMAGMQQQEPQEGEDD